MNNLEIITEIRTNLNNYIDPKTKKTSQNFFKEKIKAHGVKTSIVTRISKESFKQIKDLNNEDIFSLGEELLKSGFLEESFITFKWANYLSKNFKKKDFKILEFWLDKYVTNWASCDTLCNHPIGNFIMMYPDYIVNLKEWTKSNNRWVRRGSSSSLIIPARKGLFLNDIFEISSLLIEDKDDLVQKGYGWMLKEASRLHQDEVFNYIINNKKIMPRISLRYAIEKMPDHLRKEAMKK